VCFAPPRNVINLILLIVDAHPTQRHGADCFNTEAWSGLF